MLKKSDRIIIEGKYNFDNLRAYQQYLEYNKLKGLSKNTLNSYQSDLFSWFRYLGDKTYDKVTEEDIEEFISYCKTHGNNEDRLKRRCSSISSFYNFLRRKRMTSNHPLEFFERPVKKLGVQEKYFLKEEQVNKMKSKIKTLNDLRIETYIILSLSTAARKNALLNIKWTDIDFDEREIDVIEKGPKEVTLTFSNEAKEKLLELRNYYKIKKIQSEYVFIIYSSDGPRKAGPHAICGWVKKAGGLIDVPKLTPHSLRRTTANLLKEKGVPLEIISLILNHTDTKVTQKYIKNNLKNIKNIKDNLNI
ncbi:tyrosine-type recombinase/integrase [Romboutsia sp.]|uniref:tyrosine-type recombinase/integrase n=1 Tax=Romboutsia sp. TaxID=1965302 RepID=UPI002C1E9F18|nr:tyrosine-type recombinase/integrase [Romboutsia sp.]HSQ88694.1 tyrosine-type recombinase/integrase [Romboutsia sp.]